MRRIHAVALGAAALVTAAAATIGVFAAQQANVIGYEPVPSVDAPVTTQSSTPAPTQMTVPALPEESLQPAPPPESTYRDDITGG